MSIQLYQDLGAVQSSGGLAYLDYTTLNKFAAQVKAMALKSLKDNPSSSAVIVTMQKGGLNPAAKLFADEGEAADAFYELNNSGAFDAGVIYMGRRGEALGEGVLGPLPHAKPTFKWKSAAPWILLGAIGVGAVVYYTRRTVKRRRAAGAR